MKLLSHTMCVNFLIILVCSPHKYTFSNMSFCTCWLYFILLWRSRESSKHSYEINVVWHHDWSPYLEMDGWCFCFTRSSCGKRRIHRGGNVSRSLLLPRVQIRNDLLWDELINIQDVAGTYCVSDSMLICAWKGMNNSSDMKVRGYSHKLKPAERLGNVCRKFCLFLEERWFRLLQQGIPESAKQNRDGPTLRRLRWR